MTVAEFLSRFDADHENTVTQSQKVRWLKRIELTVMSDVMHQHYDYDKPGIRNDVIRYAGDDMTARITDDGGFDISDLPDMYIDGDTLVLTSYEPTMGEREADNFDMGTMLQIPEPYDTVYEHYLEMRIAQVTGNTVEYNRTSQLYNEAFRAFHKYYNRTHYRNRERNHLFRHEVL